MSNPSNLKYTASHEWVKTEADGSITVGITRHTRELLGDMFLVESPEVGRKVKAKEVCVVVGFAKDAADIDAPYIYAPVAGTITGFNESLDSEPEKINGDPFAAWLFKMRPDNAADLNRLMDSATYQAHVDSQAHSNRGNTMKVNVGTIDRVIRIVAGIVLITLAATGIFAPWGWIGVLPLLTGIFKFCPAYTLLGMNTRPMENK